MKIMREVIQYQYKQYKLSAKWVMPCVVLGVIWAVMYSVAPVNVVSIFSMMGLCLFCIMVWAGVTNQDMEPEVSEQIMILRLQSERKYYWYHIFFLAGLCFVVTVLSILVALLKNIMLMNTFFERSIIWSDILGGFLLMYACAFVGAMIGELFHIRIVRERGQGISATFVIALLVLTRNGLVAQYPITKYILWVVPPVSDVVSWFSNGEYFDMGKLMVGFVLLMLYGVILAVVKVEVLCKKKF